MYFNERNFNKIYNFQKNIFLNFIYRKNTNREKDFLKDSFAFNFAFNIYPVQTGICISSCSFTISHKRLDTIIGFGQLFLFGFQIASNRVKCVYVITKYYK